MKRITLGKLGALASIISVFLTIAFAAWGWDGFKARLSDTMLGWGVIVPSVLLLIVLLAAVIKWVCSRLRRWRENRNFHDMIHGLSRKELLCLFLYLRHKTLLIEFDETDPTVGLLNEKGLIYPSVRVRIGNVVSYNRSYGHGQTFNISPLLHSYLLTHPEIFTKLEDPTPQSPDRTR